MKGKHVRRYRGFRGAKLNRSEQRNNPFFRNKQCKNAKRRRKNMKLKDDLVTVRYAKWKESKLCALCGFKIWRQKHLTIDHIIPKSAGGTNAIHNLQIAHVWCNFAKGSTPPLNFRINKKKYGELVFQYYRRKSNHHCKDIMFYASFFRWYFGPNIVTRMRKSINGFLKTSIIMHLQRFFSKRT